MRRRFIITAVSDKNYHWCVSGIDLNNSNHYRLISSDTSIEGAIHKDYFRYDKENQVFPLDVIELNIISEQPQYFHPEDLVVDQKSKPRFIRKSSFIELYKYLTEYKFVLFSTDRKINTLSWDMSISVNRSLELIHVDSLYIRCYEVYGKHKIFGNFNYKGYNYEEISITDPLIKSRYFKLGNGLYLIRDCILLVSLGELFKRDSCRYKLIACIHKKS